MKDKTKAILLMLPAVIFVILFLVGLLVISFLLNPLIPLVMVISLIIGTLFVEGLEMNCHGFKSDSERLGIKLREQLEWPNREDDQ